MAGRHYFLSTFAVVLLTAGLVYAVDPQVIVGLLLGIGKLLAVVFSLALVVICLSFMAGPVER